MIQRKPAKLLEQGGKEKYDRFRKQALPECKTKFRDYRDNDISVDIIYPVEYYS